MSVPSSKVTVACCQRFLVDITHRVIFPKKEKEDLIFAAVVEIGISVILIEKSGVNLANFCVSIGMNVLLPNWAIFIKIAFSKSTRVEKPIRIILVCLSSGLGQIDAPMKEGRWGPLKIS